MYTFHLKKKKGQQKTHKKRKKCKQKIAFESRKEKKF